jgi:hypothetical protein
MTTTEALRDKRVRSRARIKRISHPLSERLIADLEGAPDAIRDAHETTERMVKVRREQVLKVREAQETKTTAPARDAEAARDALAAGNDPPEPTEKASEAAYVEARRLYELAKENEEEALDRLAEVIAENADEWQAARSARLTEKSATVAEQLANALDAWQELDVEFAQDRWLHKLDPDRPGTLSPSKVRGLQLGELDAERVLTGLARLAEQAPERAREGESGRQRRAQARAERAARRKANRKVAA